MMHTKDVHLMDKLWGINSIHVFLIDLKSHVPWNYSHSTALHPNVYLLINTLV